MTVATAMVMVTEMTTDNDDNNEEIVENNSVKKLIRTSVTTPKIYTAFDR